MAYIDISEYTAYGLSEKTPEALTAAASELIDAYCRRPTIGVAQYTERFRLKKANTVRLTYLPLTAASGANSPVVSLRGKYGAVTRDWFDSGSLLSQLQAFATPGEWVAQDPSCASVDPTTGEVMFGFGPLGMPTSEVEVTYTAGCAVIPEKVKHACAMIVRNAQATPALNVRATNVDRMHMEYFSDSLLDSNVKRLLAPYVAQKVG